MGFEEEYQAFLLLHSRSRKGERLRRLMEGHGPTEKMFLENVWWPLFSNFHYLHPEYEVADFKDGRRYLDFAYIRTGARICFEIDGYGPSDRSARKILAGMAKKGAVVPFGGKQRIRSYQIGEAIRNNGKIFR